ncbi:unnamed protein product [Ixodes hexagonus]
MLVLSCGELSGRLLMMTIQTMVRQSFAQGAHSQVGSPPASFPHFTAVWQKFRLLRNQFLQATKKNFVDSEKVSIRPLAVVKLSGQLLWHIVNTHRCSRPSIR